MARPPSPERRIAAWLVLALPFGFAIALMGLLAGLASAVVFWIALGCALVGIAAAIVVMVDVRRDINAVQVPEMELPRAIARPAERPRRD